MLAAKRQLMLHPVVAPVEGSIRLSATLLRAMHREGVGPHDRRQDRRLELDRRETVNRRRWILIDCRLVGSNYAPMH